MQTFSVGFSSKEIMTMCKELTINMFMEECGKKIEIKWMHNRLLLKLIMVSLYT